MRTNQKVHQFQEQVEEITDFEFNEGLILSTSIEGNLGVYDIRKLKKANLYALSYMLGYRPKISYASTTLIDIYQLIPSISTGGVSQPDYTYALIIPANTSLTSKSTGTKFLTIDKVNFNDTINTEISFVDANYFLLKKQCNIYEKRNS